MRKEKRRPGVTPALAPMSLKTDTVASVDWPKSCVDFEGGSIDTESDALNSYAGHSSNTF